MIGEIRIKERTCSGLSILDLIICYSLIEVFIHTKIRMNGLKKGFLIFFLGIIINR